MDKSTRYKKIVKGILSKYVEIFSEPSSETEEILVADDVKGHYLWLGLGWKNGKRQNHQVANIRIRNGKIWIETDLTEQGIATDLLNEGVPKKDIVLAFHEPSVRQYTEFAVA